jgi:hypothetical protein
MVVRVAEPAFLGQELLVPRRPVVCGLEHQTFARLHVDDERAQLISSHAGND